MNFVRTPTCSDAETNSIRAPSEPPIRTAHPNSPSEPPIRTPHPNSPSELPIRETSHRLSGAVGEEEQVRRANGETGTCQRAYAGNPHAALVHDRAGVFEVGGVPDRLVSQHVGNGRRRNGIRRHQLGDQPLAAIKIICLRSVSTPKSRSWSDA